MNNERFASARLAFDSTRSYRARLAFDSTRHCSLSFRFVLPLTLTSTSCSILGFDSTLDRSIGSISLYSGDSARLMRLNSIRSLSTFALIVVDTIRSSRRLLRLFDFDCRCDYGARSTPTFTSFLVLFDSCLLVYATRLFSLSLFSFVAVFGLAHPLFVLFVLSFCCAFCVSRSFCLLFSLSPVVISRDYIKRRCFNLFLVLLLKFKLERVKRKYRKNIYIYTYKNLAETEEQKINEQNWVITVWTFWMKRTLYYYFLKLLYLNSVQSIKSMFINLSKY